MESDPNQPRKLTDSELNDILSVVPNLKGAVESVSDFNRKSMLVLLREQLKEVYVTPLGINDIKAEIIRLFQDALVKPGSMVGVTAAESMGGPITQGALNSFHKSGSAKNVSYGVSRMRELINASVNIKNTSCSIFFKNPNVSFDDVILNKRRELREITFSNIIKNIPLLENTEDFDEPFWYDIFRLTVRNDFKAHSFLRLNLDVNVMYAYKITMLDAVKVIEKDQPVICVYSPLSIGIIDIYPVEKVITGVQEIKNIQNIDERNASLIFLWKIVIPVLDKLKIQGVSGIVQLYPVETPVWQIVKEEQKAPNIENGYFLVINDIKQRMTGISTSKLVNLCKTVGMDVFKIRPNYLGVKTKNGESPTILVNRIIKEDKENEKKYEENRKRNGEKIIRRPPTEISKASKMVYADTDGTNLIELLGKEDIDSSRSYSNNVHEIKDALGIEAARTFLIKEFLDVIHHEGSYINPRHVALLVTYMTSLGNVLGVTFTGVSKQPISALAKASFEKAMNTFKEAGGFGEKREIKGTSDSIYIGKRSLIGTGFSDQFMDAAKYTPLEDEIASNPNLKLDIGNFEDAILEMTELISGADMVVAEGAEAEMFNMEPSISSSSILPVSSKMDPRSFEQLKSIPVRSQALEEVAQGFNLASCLPPKPVPKITVSDIESPLKTESLPTIPGAKILPGPIPVATTIKIDQLLNLPPELLREMEKFQISEPPSKLELPSVGMPLPPISMEKVQPVMGGFVPEIKKEEKQEEKPVILFDLSSFLQ